MIGHAGPSIQDNTAMQCAGFQVLLLRGCEWAAKGKVTQKEPSDFPTAEKPSFRKGYSTTNWTSASGDGFLCEDSLHE